MSDQAKAPEMGDEEAALGWIRDNIPDARNGDKATWMCYSGYREAFLAGIKRGEEKRQAEVAWLREESENEKLWSKRTDELWESAKAELTAERERAAKLVDAMKEIRKEVQCAWAENRNEHCWEACRIIDAALAAHRRLEDEKGGER